jgi:hypothetical protein
VGSRENHTCIHRDVYVKDSKVYINTHSHSGDIHVHTHLCRYTQTCRYMHARMCAHTQTHREANRHVHTYMCKSKMTLWCRCGSRRENE